jgi:xylulose-5-phosphate/fructose-6-phosphate phosphoketolase
MTVRNDMDRFHLVMDVLERAEITGEAAVMLREMMQKKLIEHTNYVNQFGIDMPEIRDWKWNF